MPWPWCFTSCITFCSTVFWENGKRKETVCLFERHAQRKETAVFVVGQKCKVGVGGCAVFICTYIFCVCFLMCPTTSKKKKKLATYQVPSTIFEIDIDSCSVVLKVHAYCDFKHC